MCKSKCVCMCMCHFFEEWRKGTASRRINKAEWEEIEWKRMWINEEEWRTTLNKIKKNEEKANEWSRINKAEWEKGEWRIIWINEEEWGTTIKRIKKNEIYEWGTRKNAEQKYGKWKRGKNAEKGRMRNSSLQTNKRSLKYDNLGTDIKH